MYYPISELCRQQAYKQGLADYEEVSKIILEDKAREIQLKAKSDYKSCLSALSVPLPLDILEHSPKSISISVGGRSA